jgi:hypothetical protein
MLELILADVQCTNKRSYYMESWGAAVAQR